MTGEGEERESQSRQAGFKATSLPTGLSVRIHRRLACSLFLYPSLFSRKNDRSQLTSNCYIRLPAIIHFPTDPMLHEPVPARFRQCQLFGINLPLLLPLFVRQPSIDFTPILPLPLPTPPLLSVQDLRSSSSVLLSKQIQQHHISSLPTLPPPPTPPP